MLLLNTWRDVELAASSAGQPGDVAMVEKRMPRKVKVRRAMHGDDGEEEGSEEFYDYVFPDEAKKMPGMGILEKAMKWKQLTAAAELSKAKEAEEGGDEGEKGEAGEEGESALGKRKAGADGDEIDIDDDL